MESSFSFLIRALEELVHKLPILIILTGIVVAVLIKITMKKKQELILLQKLSAEDAKVYLENIKKTEERRHTIRWRVILGTLLIYIIFSIILGALV